MKLKSIQSTNIKEEWEKAQEQGYKGLQTEVPVEMKYNEEENSFHTIASTPRQDRDGEVVVQRFDLRNFKKNPAVLDSHKYSSIEHILGRYENVTTENGQLEGDIVFSEKNPKAVMAQAMAQENMINTVSIGFIPKKFDEEDPSIITESELLEVSLVSVPSNPEALIEGGAKAFEDIESALKQGRTLSAKNKEDLLKAKESIEKVLSRAEGQEVEEQSEDEKDISDTNEKAEDEETKEDEN